MEMFINLTDFDHNILLLLGFALFFGTIGGRIFQKLKIPQVVGYIVLGIIIGQSGLKLLSINTLKAMEPFNFFALGLIGFLIGGELKIATLKKYGKQFTYILFFEALGAFFVVSLLVFFILLFITSNIPFSIAVALMLGSISSATAAAGVTDVLWECKSRGPLTTTIFGVVALDDVLALFLFAISASVAGSLIGSGEKISLVMSILHPVYEIGVAVIIGSVAGYILSKLVLHYSDHEKILVFSLGAILFILGLSIAIKVDMIMASMLTGFILTNLTGKKSEETFSLINKFSPPIYVVFFVMVGAKLNIGSLDILSAILLVAYLVGRSVGKMIGSRSGAIISHAPKSVQKFLMYTLFSQSGVAIGLSILAAQKFPSEAGSYILIVVTASTFIVQLIGPPFVKYAVDKAGESGLNITEEDIIASSLVSDFIHGTPPIIKSTDNLNDILKIFSDSDNLYYPVVDNKKKLLGIISVDEIKNTFLLSELKYLLAAVDMMECCATFMAPNTPMKELVETVRKDNIEYVSVVDKFGVFHALLETKSIKRQLARKLMEVHQKIESMG